ncbi:pyridoxamine 5'-phosphate oxidase family protein [Streptomyces sp. MBT65]|uniref:pyridoxamine 5'-phosphate oxidase family protein n=1 Tax=Streptomyces sp. MBT65 TaxID=1488395 RepID=UPI001F354C7B|nr:pyridoxamine 5'-phosphate oxidase family protein [Streptomyces sp. MBT65]
MTELSREESLSLLAGIPLGRVGFTHRALPVIRPVNHLVDGDTIIIRTHTGSALTGSSSVAEVVVYEADDLDLLAHTGWSVMVTGRASRITAPLDISRYQKLLTPWIDKEMDHLISIASEIVTGFRLER